MCGCGLPGQDRLVTEDGESLSLKIHLYPLPVIDIQGMEEEDMLTAELEAFCSCDHILR